MPSFTLSLPLEALWKPLAPIGEPEYLKLDHGGPFTLAVPQTVASQYRYLTYTTGQTSPDGKGVFRSYGSNNLIDWYAIGSVLETNENVAHWAPAVAYLPPERRKYQEKQFVLMYSTAKGCAADDSHRDHKIVTAYSDSPAGPFIPSGTILSRGDTVALDDGTLLQTHNQFAIDPDLSLRPDGNFDLLFCINLVHKACGSEIIGTGIVSSIWDPGDDRLNEVPTLVSRPSSPWHLYDSHRDVEKVGIVVPDLQPGACIPWGCKEGPAILSDKLALYSGGCFQPGKFYAVGILMKRGDRWVDISEERGSCLLFPEQVPFVSSIGHCSSFVDEFTCRYIMTHVRIDKGERQMMIVPLFERGGIPWSPTPQELQELRERGEIRFVGWAQEKAKGSGRQS